MFEHWRWSYGRVDTDSSDDNLDEKTPLPDSNQEYSRPFTRKAKNLIYAALTVSGVVILLSIALYFHTTSPAQSRNSSIRPCGNSSAEALARGCSFDQLMWAWFPKHCPHYANDNFLQAEPERPWVFYTDPHTKEVATEDKWSKVLDNEIFVYGERREHLTHCVYMFLNLGQIFRDGGRYTPKHVNYEHVEHCAGIMLKSLRNDSTWYDLETFAGPVSYDQDC
jgi:hypothetical protein